MPTEREKVWKKRLHVDAGCEIKKKEIAYSRVEKESEKKNIAREKGAQNPFVTYVIGGERRGSFGCLTDGNAQPAG